MAALASFDTLRSLNFSGISAAYAAVGSPTTHPIRAVCISNNTHGDMLFSTDSSISAGQLFVAAGSFKLFDIQANINPQFDDKYTLPVGAQFYCKQLTAPVDGDVYIECLR